MGLGNDERADESQGHSMLIVSSSTSAVGDSIGRPADHIPEQSHRDINQQQRINQENKRVLY